MCMHVRVCVWGVVRKRLMGRKNENKANVSIQTCRVKIDLSIKEERRWRHVKEEPQVVVELEAEVVEEVEVEEEKGEVEEEEGEVEKGKVEVDVKVEREVEE